MTAQKSLEFARLMLQCLVEANAVDGKQEAENMIRDLENEIQWSAAKKNGKITEKQRTKAMEKFIAPNKDRMPDLCAAFPMTEQDLPASLYGHTGKSGFVTGYAIIVTDPIIGATQPDGKYRDKNPPIFADVLYRFMELPHHAVENFDPASVSVHIAAKKAEAKAMGYRYKSMDGRTMLFTLENGDAYGLDPDYLMELVTMLGGEDIQLSLPEKPTEAAKIESPRGIAFLLPVRV